jgi:pyruvate formate lyase activating enzyme
MAGDSRINRSRCGACGACARECPSGALEKIGRIATVEEIVSVVERDRPFYETSKGGATLSGGEPFYQFDFTIALLSAFREKNISTAVESCLLTQWEKINAARSLVDVWLCDIKVIDSQKHKKLCGVENSLILENAKKLAETGADVTFRTPLVPECNDSAQDIRELGEFISSIPNGRLQLMPYHGIGVGKYDALGIDYSLRDTEAPENLSELISTLKSMGVNMIEE